jgi:hypothetical protein
MDNENLIISGLFAFGLLMLFVVYYVCCRGEQITDILNKDVNIAGPPINGFMVPSATFKQYQWNSTGVIGLNGNNVNQLNSSNDGIVINYTGLYKFNISVRYNDTVAAKSDDTSGLLIYVNGVSTPGQAFFAPDGSGRRIVSLNYIMHLQQGDVVSFILFQGSGQTIGVMWLSVDMAWVVK